MPELDLDPADYRERKPKGWRWRLPWGHAEDTKLPVVMLLVSFAALAYIFVRRDEMATWTLFGVTAVFSVVAGIMFTTAFRD